MSPRPRTPDRGKIIPILLRTTDEARAVAAGRTLAAHARLALDVLHAVEDDAGIATLRRMVVTLADDRALTPGEFLDRAERAVPGGKKDRT